MTDIDDRPRDMSTAGVTEYYRRQFPLYDAYCSVINEYNYYSGPVTQPNLNPGQVDNVRAAGIALERIGMTASDHLTRTMAAAFIDKLHQEIRAMSTDEPSLDGIVISHHFSYAGCIPSVEEWHATSTEDQDYEVAELFDAMPADMLREALKLAMPLILQRIIDDDTARRAAVLG